MLGDTDGDGPLWIAAQEGKVECIAALAAAKATIDGARSNSPIGKAARNGADDCVRLLAHLGARFIEPTTPDSSGGPFWCLFKDNVTRVRNPKVWEWIVSKGGDKGTGKSLQKRIKFLKQAGLEDPRDENSW